MSNPKAESMARYAAAVTMADSLRAVSGGVEPKVLVVLGSGLDGVVGETRVVSTIDFADVPGFPAPTVQGHAGRFVFGYVGETPALIMQGRIHLYEGHPVELLAVYVRAAKLLGCETFVVTNAAGGVNPAYDPGDIVLIEDHINLMLTNPLMGPNVDEFGPRFPAMVDAYTPALRDLARQVAAELDIDIREGVYAGLRGPTFETPAEVRMLHTLGADVVGMSTVPEVIVAAHAGMRVLGFSLVTNVAASTGHGHEEVLATSAAAAPRLATLVAGILSRL
ncbi:MAG: purine-nucleoside phosphorylase [Actinobacteria bacterium]|nr:purine-nucleoside phosphorylase [Actinomycetota bacterium]MCG2807449.1 purine-nucleoside phosphorylase [Coriobacteriia bacterium]